LNSNKRKLTSTFTVALLSKKFNKKNILTFSFLKHDFDNIIQKKVENKAQNSLKNGGEKSKKIEHIRADNQTFNDNLLLHF